MASFDITAAKTLRIEGGYQDDPDDDGNYLDGELLGTNLGITPAVYQKYLGRKPTVSDMKAITEEIALDVYRKRDWEKIKGDYINSQEVADLFFDAAVHGYYVTAIRLMQDVLVKSFGENIGVDGNAGSQTINAINRQDAGRLHNAYKRRRKVYYDRVVLKEPKKLKYYNGWLNRLAKFPDLPEGVETFDGGILVEATVTAAVNYNQFSDSIADYLIEFTPINNTKGINLKRIVQVAIALVLIIWTTVGVLKATQKRKIIPN